MIRYNLIISFTDFKDDHKHDVIMVVSPVVGSQNFSYIYRDGLFIFHFESEMNNDEIKSYVYDAFYGHKITGIFVSETDKMSVYLPNDDEKWFFDLNNENSELNLSSVNMTNVKNGSEGFSILDFLEDDDEDDDDDVKKIIRDAKKKIQIPTLDDLLEKIYDKGIETLTKDEQQILKTYIK